MKPTRRASYEPLARQGPRLRYSRRLGTRRELVRRQGMYVLCAGRLAGYPPPPPTPHPTHSPSHFRAVIPMPVTRHRRRSG